MSVEKELAEIEKRAGADFHTSATDLYRLVRALRTAENCLAEMEASFANQGWRHVSEQIKVNRDAVAAILRGDHEDR